MPGWSTLQGERSCDAGQAGCHGGTSDEHGQTVTVRAWADLHLRTARDIPLTAVCLTRTTASGSYDLWLWWVGGPLPPVAALPRLDAARFGIEHAFKMDKGELLWTVPHLREPASIGQSHIKQRGP